MATPAQWIEGARPRTLPTAVAPVAIGTGAAIALGAHFPSRALLALGVALMLQIGVNYANDYSDGVRGTDEVRVGPLRLTGSGAATPRQVKTAAFVSFGIACALGLALVVACGAWWLIAVGVACVLAAWGYTGGKNPYGYNGLGEVFVFVFFGLVAVLGTTYTQAGRISWEAVVGACATGLLACSVLVTNNQRDIATDTLSGKKTLSVRIGDAASRKLYVALIAVPLIIAAVTAIWHPWVALSLVMAVPAIRTVRTMLSGATGRDLIAVLKATGLIQLGFGLLFGLGLAL